MSGIGLLWPKTLHQRSQNAEAFEQKQRTSLPLLSRSFEKKEMILRKGKKKSLRGFLALYGTL